MLATYGLVWISVDTLDRMSTMAKKKNQSKKHKFKHVETPASVQTVNPDANAAQNMLVASPKLKPSAVKSSSSSVVHSGKRDFSYLSKDLRKIFILAVSLVLLEVALSLVFSHTSVGPSIYKLVNV